MRRRKNSMISGMKIRRLLKSRKTKIKVISNSRPIFYTFIISISQQFYLSNQDIQWPQITLCLYSKAKDLSLRPIDLMMIGKTSQGKGKNGGKSFMPSLANRVPVHQITRREVNQKKKERSQMKSTGRCSITSATEIHSITPLTKSRKKTSRVQILTGISQKIFSSPDSSSLPNNKINISLSLQSLYKNLKIIQIMKSNPIQHVVDPYVVGGAIIGLKCKDGIVIGADTLLSYGSLLKYQDVSRFEKITDDTVIVASGQYADFQQITRKLKELTSESALHGGKSQYSVKELMNYLAHISYQKRNNFNPYYNSTVIAGYKGEESVLASIDLFGTLIKKDYVVTGFAKHFGLALIANEWNPNISVQEGKNVIRRAFSVIYMRDCHSLDQVQFSVVTSQGAQIERPEKIPSTWDFKEFRERANEKLWQ